MLWIVARIIRYWRIRCLSVRCLKVVVAVWWRGRIVGHYERGTQINSSASMAR